MSQFRSLLLLLILGMGTAVSVAVFGAGDSSVRGENTSPPPTAPLFQSAIEKEDKSRDNVVPALVFVSRNPIPSSLHDDPGAIPGIGPHYRTIIVGGKLLVRESDGSTRVLVDSAQLIDVADPSVSWDGKTILFSGVAHADSNWRIYQINADGTGFTQLTHTDRMIDLSQFGEAASYFRRYDDFDPCYLPDGSIVFASTRYPSLASLGQVPTSNLYVMDPDGSGVHRITTERNGGEEPTVDPLTGRIVYSRWWVNIDLPSNNSRNGLARDYRYALTTDAGNVWHAATIKPDGDELKMYAGFPRTRFGSHTYKPALLGDGRLLSTFTPNTSMTPTIKGTGIRWFNKGASFEHHIVGVRSDESLRQRVKIDPPFAADPIGLTSNTILFSFSFDGRDYGLYTCKLDGSGLRKVFDLPGTLELDAQVLQSRIPPPVEKLGFAPAVFELPPTEDPSTYFKNDFFRFDCMNIFTNGKVDEPIPHAPKIALNARIRFFMNVQRQNPRFPDPSIYLKDAEVFPNGGVHEHDVPAEVPLFEQVVDGDGNVLQTPEGNFAHVPGLNFERQGAGTKCVGCHAGHSMLPVPKSGIVAEWFNVSTSARATSSSHLVKDGKSYGPERVTDRQARTGGDTVNWVSKHGVGSFIELSWDIPVEVRELVLYNITPVSRKGTTIVVLDSEVVLYYQSSEVGRATSTGKLASDGTSVRFPPTTVDAVKIIIKKFSGKVNHYPVAGLAEVETIARISPVNYAINAEELE